GHARDREEAERLLTMLDAFLGAVLEHVDLSKTTVMLISDHGNVEDLSVKTHTRNPVPGLFAGAGRDWFAGAIRSLTDVTPAIVGRLTGGGRGAGGRSRRLTSDRSKCWNTRKSSRCWSGTPPLRPARNWRGSCCRPPTRLPSAKRWARPRRPCAFWKKALRT